MYAIVDIETTGGSSKLHHITEVAIIEHNGVEETGRFQTLINPGVPIPPRITQLTGITNEMVAGAPMFHQVAKEIWNRTEGRVFVAHNVHFDFGFIRQQFQELGGKWSPKRLCTVRLSRKLIPGLRSYSLGSLALHMGEGIQGRHRAMGDCAFTTRLFEHLLSLDKENAIGFALNMRNREATLPPNIPRAVVDQLPEALGVYSFLNAQGKVIYVGKANNIKKRVSEHLRGNTHTGFKSRFAEKIADVRWQVCPNELIALLTEAGEIKKHWPPYNKVMKRISLNWGIYAYTDQRGLGRFSLGRVGKWDNALMSYRSHFEARIALERLCRSHGLCQRLCGLSEAPESCTSGGGCSGVCGGAEDPALYAAKHEAARAALVSHHEAQVILGRGYKDGERSVVLISKGRYKGHGLLPEGIDMTQKHLWENQLHTAYDDQDMQTIIRGYLLRVPTTEVICLG